MIAVPSYSGTMCTQFVMSLVKVVNFLSDQKIEFSVNILPGDCFIASARNRLVTEFLSSPLNNLFFIDDDVGFNLEAFQQILYAPTDFEAIAGVYPQKLDGKQSFACELVQDESTQEFVNIGGYFQAKTVPGGFLNLRRSAVEKLRDHSDTYTWPNLKGELVEHYAIFEAGIDHEHKEFIGEDTFLSHRLSHLDIPIFVKADLDFTHDGRKIFKGNLFKDAIEKYGE